MRFRFYFLFLISPFSAAFAQEKNDDIKVILHEQTLNKLFTALGPVYGSDTYTFLLVKGTYHWTLLNPHIELRDSSAEYVADVAVETGPFNYKSKVKGKVSITYAADSNKIIIRITEAILPLYTKVFGTEVHIKDIDLALSYKDPFVFDGPLSIRTDMDFSMPDGNVRRVHAIPVHCGLIVKDHKIVVACDIEFITQSIRK
jgi:hypothetical protein